VSLVGGNGAQLLDWCSEIGEVYQALSWLDEHL